MMPDLDGYQVCRLLRSLPGGADLRIVMLTAKAMPKERRAGLDAGSNAYLTKPSMKSELLAAIEAPLPI
jgi:CheY-like chemotaxis protein